MPVMQKIPLEVAPLVSRLNNKRERVVIQLYQTPVVTDYKGGPVLNVFRDFLQQDELEQLLATTKTLANNHQLET
jgi:hypothetical protein